MEIEQKFAYCFSPTWKCEKVRLPQEANLKPNLAFRPLWHLQVMEAGSEPLLDGLGSWTDRNRVVKK